MRPWLEKEGGTEEYDTDGGSEREDASCGSSCASMPIREGMRWRRWVEVESRFTEELDADGDGPCSVPAPASLLLLLLLRRRGSSASGRSEASWGLALFITMSWCMGQ